MVGQLLLNGNSSGSHHSRALRAGSNEVELDYPINFVQTIQSTRTAATETFRYMHVSGVMAEKDQKKPLWFLQEGRRVKVRLLLTNSEEVFTKIVSGTGRDRAERPQPQRCQDRSVGNVYCKTVNGPSKSCWPCESLGRMGSGCRRGRSISSGNDRYCGEWRGS